MSDENGNKIQIGGTGIGILTTLTIIFVVLKLVGVIDWSWWWVLAPTWIPCAVCCPIVIVIGAILLIVYLVRDRL